MWDFFGSVPGGPYASQGGAIAYDKIAPVPDPTEGADAAEQRTVFTTPALLEQLYHDATVPVGSSSNRRRALWFIGIVEDTAKEIGFEVAGRLHRIGCLTVYNCGIDWRVPLANFSDQTASGRRVRGIVLHSFIEKSFELDLDLSLINNAALLLGGLSAAKAGLAKVGRPGPIAGDKPTLPQAPVVGKEQPATPTAAPEPGSPQKGEPPPTQQQPEPHQPPPPGRQQQQQHQPVGVRIREPEPQPKPRERPENEQQRPREQQHQQQQTKTPAPTVRPAKGLPTLEEDAVVQEYTRELAEFRDKRAALETAKATRPRDTEAIKNAQKAEDAVRRRLDAIEKAAAEGKAGELAEHLDPLTKEREIMKRTGMQATATGTRVPCEAVRKLPSDLRYMDVADIEKGLVEQFEKETPGKPIDKTPGNPLKQALGTPTVDAAAKAGGAGLPEAHQRITWKFADGSSIVIDVPRKLGGRAASAERPHIEFHGPKGQRLDAQGIEIPEASIGAHVTITDYGHVLEKTFLGPARAGR